MWQIKNRHFDALLMFPSRQVSLRVTFLIILASRILILQSLGCARLQSVFHILCFQKVPVGATFKWIVSSTNNSGSKTIYTS